MIGLEIHVQLKTKTKMFCRCANGFGGEPNTQTCPVCLAFPGALPVPNGRAIEETIKLGLALGCDHRRPRRLPPQELLLSRTTRRRTRSPSTTSHSAQAVSWSCRRPTATSRSGSMRAHLEEDAAKNVHVAASGRIHGATATLVDFNRGGIAAARDRDRARHPLLRRRQALPAAAAPDRRRARPLRRGAREGLDALRRQRLRAAGGLRRAAHTHRAEEHELVQLRGEGDREGDRTPDRDLRGGRDRPAGDAALRPGQRGLAAAALEGRGRRTTATSRSPTSCRFSPPAELVERLRAYDRRAAERDGSSGSPTRSRSTTPTCSSPAGSTGSGRRCRCGRAPIRKKRRTCSRTSSSPRATIRRSVSAAELAKLVSARAEIPRAAFDEALAHSG